MKTSFLITCFIFGFCIISCVEDDPYGDCGYIPPHFEILGIESFNRRLTDTYTNPWEAIDENESISWDNFFVRFGFEMNYIASNSSFGSSLFALTCVENGYEGDTIGIDTLIVKTVGDFNERYPAGAVINDIVLTNDWIYSFENSYEFEPLTDYIIKNTAGVLNQAFEHQTKSVLLSKLKTPE